MSTAAPPVPAADPRSLAVREQLTTLRALLVLSILMTESADEEQILHLAASCAPSLGPWRVRCFALDQDRERVAQELAAAAATGGQLRIPDAGWAWAYPLRGAAELIGYLVAQAEAPPTAEEQFLIQVVAQQAGVAVCNARLHQRERAGALELRRVNQLLEQTVGTLRRGMRIHQRLTAVAAAGEGVAGIADALHELTGFPVVIEDRYGNVKAWAGAGRPVPSPKPPRVDRDQLIRRLLLDGTPVRDGARVVALASPRPDVLGTISLIDPHEAGDAADLVALEHGATVLAVELARVRGLADAELRLRRDLLHELLSGLDDDTALSKAEALGYDLGRPHRVVLIDGDLSGHAEDTALHAIRNALRRHRLTALLGVRAGQLLMLVGEAEQAVDWEAVRLSVVSALGGTRCRLAVGGRYERPSQLPASRREALLALRLQSVPGIAEQTTVHGELGVFQMFAAMPDLADIESYAQRWLGPLIDYDRAKGTALVATLGRYLDNGGRYQPTALALSVHRSTLKYRLHRIRELTGLDIGDPAVKFDLQLATRAWATVRALRD